MIIPRDINFILKMGSAIRGVKDTIEISRSVNYSHDLWFGKQNDIIKCKCDVVMTIDLGKLQSAPKSLAITKLSRITCRIS